MSAAQGPAPDADPAAVAASYLASFSSGDPEAIAAHVSADFVNEHTSALGDPCRTRAVYAERLAGFLDRFADLSYEPEEILTDGDRVAVAYVMRARCEGRPFEIRGVFRMRITEGLITHRTDYFDSLSFLRQTGQI